MKLITKLNQEKARMDKLSYINIVLISKKNTAEYIIDYRPISLLISTVKIILKILANRLAPKLPELVGKYQTGFIKRSILDGIVITHEVVHQMKEKRRGFSLKLDFEKAYNKVNWDCLIEILRARKFGLRWTSWIEN